MQRKKIKSSLYKKDTEIFYSRQKFNWVGNLNLRANIYWNLELMKFSPAWANRRKSFPRTFFLIKFSQMSKTRSTKFQRKIFRKVMSDTKWAGQIFFNWRSVQLSIEIHIFVLQILIGTGPEKLIFDRRSSIFWKFADV